MITEVCQRWKDQRGVYRLAREAFNPAHYEVAEFKEDTLARAFVADHHYTGTLPPVERRFGLYARGGRMVGVAIFTTPMNYASLRPWKRGSAMELGRLVLLDEILANAETWLVAECFRRLKGEGLAGVVSHSDPEPRTDAAGNVVFHGHIGTVYQALNAVYTGRASPRSMRILPNGKELSNRAASKLRQGERGQRYAVRQLVSVGAREPGPGEDIPAWFQAEVKRLTRTQRHRGNHRYVFALSKGAMRDLRKTGLPYPKFDSAHVRGLLVTV